MKYAKVIFGIIIIWCLVVGFAYSMQNRAKKEIEGGLGIEGFDDSGMNGILRDGSGNLMKCSVAGKQVSGPEGIGYCMDLSYIDQKGIMQSGKRVPIYSNYYVDSNTGVLQHVPYGFMANPNQIGITPKTLVAAYDISVNGISNIDIPGTMNIYQNYLGNLDNIPSFHDDYTNGEYAPDGGGLPTGYMWIKDENGKLSMASIFDSSFNSPLYYEPGSRPYGGKNYVPTYENSVYLSNLANYSQITNVTLAPLVSSNDGGGFCNKMKDDPYSLNIECSRLDSNTCSSMACCNVLEGGKCVGGNRMGPFYPDSITDIVNRDFYYYQGKCYGSCNR